MTLRLQRDAYIKANFILEDPMNDSLSANSLKHTNKIKVCPNPFNDKINVLTDTYSGSFNIYSIEGRVVRQGDFDSPVIELADLPKGIFVLDITTGGYHYRKQIVKQ